MFCIDCSRILLVNRELKSQLFLERRTRVTLESDPLAAFVLSIEMIRVVNQVLSSIDRVCLLHFFLFLIATMNNVTQSASKSSIVFDFAQIFISCSFVHFFENETFHRIDVNERFHDWMLRI